MYSDVTSSLTEKYERRGAMLGALQKIFEICSCYGKDDVSLGSLLSDGAALMSEITGTDHIGVFRLAGDGARRMKRIHNWVKEENQTPAVDEDSVVLSAESDAGDWFHALEANESVCFICGGLSGDEDVTASDGQYGFMKKLIVPVFSGGALWGAVSFENLIDKRPIDDDAISFLRSAAAIGMSLIIQDEKTTEADRAFDAYKSESETSLDTLKVVLNSFDGVILATVQETGEILFINNKLKAAYGIEGDGAGRNCYEFLHGRTERCDYCKYRDLEKEPGKPFRWELTDPRMNNIFSMTGLLIDWPGGKKAHLEIGVDIAEIKHSQEILVKILSGLDALIMATDPQTGEILYLHDKNRGFFGAEGEWAGKICYEYLHDRTERCDFCPCDRVIKEPDKAVLWETYYSDTDTTHSVTSLMIDWPGGKKAQLDFGVDISAAKRAQEALERRENMLAALNRAAIVLLTKNDEAFEKAMTEGVGLIADITCVDRMSISRNIKKSSGLHASQIYRWSKAAGTAVETLAELQVNSYNRHIPRWRDALAMGNHINGPVRLMPESEALKRFGCVSALAIPVFNEGAFWGFVLFENLTEEREFTPDEVDILRSASFMLANVVIRHEEAEKVREADERSKLILESMPYACTLINKNHEVFDCNDALLKLFRLENKRRFLDDPFIISPECQLDGTPSTEGAVIHIEKAFKEGYCSFSWTHVTIDGEEIPTESIFVRRVYKDEHILVGFIRDRRQYIQMLREIETRSLLAQTVSDMSAILLKSNADAFENDLRSSMGSMAGVIDVDRVTVWKNAKKHGRIFCSKAYEWRSRKIEGIQSTDDANEFSYEDDLPGWLEILSHKRNIKGVISEFSGVVKKTLTLNKVLSILVVPVFIKGELWGLIGFDDCHTERLFTESEESILRSASELISDALVRNDMEESLRTSALKLQKALSEAQSASRAKSDFLSRMSHEIRTPMNAIIGMTAIGKSSQSVEKKDYAFDKVGEASEHLLGVINDVLDMSKIEANKLELVNNDFIFEETLEKAVNVVNFRINERRQSLYINTDENIPSSLTGDDQRLTQVIVNLLSNAVKFTPEEGSITLSAKLLSERLDMCRIEISVADNGIGLTEEQTGRIFNSFEQAEVGISRTYGGAGLGLSISKRIVEMMGGKIWVESETGKGAKFSFTIKMRRGRISELSSSDGKSPSGARNFTAGASQDFSGHTVLLAEDVEINREIVLALLEPMKLNVECAENGAEALRMFEENPEQYDMIFMDVQMPVMDGYETTRRIRALESPRAKEIPIVAMTANVFKEDIERCLESGMNSHVGKPLIIDEVAEALRKYLMF